ncbi:MAG: hypothetical protein ACI9FU_000091 [Granulosicoccus sp.]|jgi:hypothetical protein
MEARPFNKLSLLFYIYHLINQVQTKMKKLFYVSMAVLSVAIVACEKAEVTGYDCASGNCETVAGGGAYATLAACDSACSVASTTGFNCVSGNCESVTSGAAYTTQSACESACSGGGGGNAAAMIVGTWEITGSTVTPGIDTGNGTLTTNLFPADPCEISSTWYRFTAAGSFDDIDNPNCPGDGSLPDSSTYSLLGETQLILTSEYGGMTDSDTFNVNISQNSWYILYEAMVSGTTHTYKDDFTRRN